jgi:hypothetical protein
MGCHALAGPSPTTPCFRRAGRRPATVLPSTAPVTSLRRMSWHWRLEDPTGAALDPGGVGVEMPSTDNQGDAESWLGEHWRDLLARGVATVTLFDGDREVYGPMGLAPAD